MSLTIYIFCVNKEIVLVFNPYQAKGEAHVYARVLLRGQRIS